MKDCDSVLLAAHRGYSGKYPEISRKLKRKEYSAVVDRFLSLGLENGFVQELSSATKSYVPVWDI